MSVTAEEGASSQWHEIGPIQRLMAAARHFDHNAAVPLMRIRIAAMALAPIYSCLVSDSHAQVTIDQELAGHGRDT